MKKIAFTLAETLIVVMLVGVIGIVAINSMNKTKVKQKGEKLTSYRVYTALQSGYMDLVQKKCSNYSIVNLTDIDGNNSIDAGDILYFFKNYLEYLEIKSNCNDFKKIPSTFSLTGAKCAIYGSGASIAVKYDSTCKESVKVTEYDGSPEKTVANACGYIAYSTPNAEVGQLGEDFFVIALGKSSFKNNDNAKRTVGP